MIVVDASALCLALLTQDPGAIACQARLALGALCAPELIYVQVCSVIRKQVAMQRMTSFQGQAAICDLLDLKMSIFPLAPLLMRAYELRDNVKTYDAMYVALAEELDCALLTCDVRLSNATGTGCKFELV